MAKLTKQQVCDSKIKHSEIAAQHIINTSGKGLSQDYYKCEVCECFHVNTINKTIEGKRGAKQHNQYDRETYLAKRQKLKRDGFNKRGKR